MTMLKNYQAFNGRHYETGTIHNALDYLGVRAPHTNQPLSEALLLGVSGGIVFGYFTFEYKGYHPHVVLITRNTFDPTQTIFDRLALPRDVIQTTNAEKAEQNLIKVLESGHPALVWADAFSLPYNQLPFDARNWTTSPILVYGVQDDGVYIADRAQRPFRVTMDELTGARSRVKDDKFRIMVLDAPDFSRLPVAVNKGIWQCTSLYTEAPPKGKRDNFGFAAFQYWARMLTNTRNRHSWERFFPAGSKLFAALAGNVVQPGAFDWICTWGLGSGAERDVYADFLDEAAQILGKPGLTHIADQFRQSAAQWCELANAMLPDSVPLFAETRQLKLRKHDLFIQQGPDALDEIRQINSRLREIIASVEADFPLSDQSVIELRATLAEHVLKIHDLEYEAVMTLQGEMSV
ncbi:MAG: BtrH N-terminal domain-containing protein [Anaerolineae bacterium]|nr:BtrH N-terminal domain-containing protein [Anaerolineae bacterium]